MTVRLEQRLRDDLQELPPVLIPDAGIADGVLAAMRRRRRLGGAAATFAAIAVLSGVLSALPRTGTPLETGVGRGALIQVYTNDDGVFLRDETSGAFKQLPFAEATLSPDGRTVAVSRGDGLLGLAAREALLDRGDSAVTWTKIRGTAPIWSPNGAAVLVTDVLKANKPLAFVARRYDLASQRVTETELPPDIIGQAGWAADSHRYLVLLKRGETDGSVLPGTMLYVAPDGERGPVIEVTGGEVAGYSPDGGYLLLDCSRLMTATPLPSKLIEVATDRVVREFAGRPIGWADRSHYVLLAGTSLELIDAGTGQTIEVISIDDRMAGLIRASVMPAAG